MGIAKPLGRYVEQMLGLDAWPEVSEDIFFDRAQEWTEVLRQITEVLYASQYQRSEIFEGGRWSGSAATAANAAIGANIHQLIALQNGLATVITWQRYIAGSIIEAKSTIADIIEVANQRINVIANDSGMAADARTAAINALVQQAQSENAGVSAGIAELIRASKSWKPPNSALKDLLDQKIPPRVTVPAAPQESVTPPVESGGPRAGVPRPLPGNPVTEPPTQTPGTTEPPAKESTPSPQPPGEPNSGLTPGSPVGPMKPPTGPPIPSSPTTAPATPSGPRDPGLSTPPGLEPQSPATPFMPAAPSGPAGPSRPSPSLRPAASTKSPAAAAEPGEEMAPLSSLAGQPPSNNLTGAGPDEVASAPEGAGGMPMAPGGAGAGAGSSSSGGTAAPVGKSSDKAAPATRPAAAARATGAPRAPDLDKPTSARRESSTDPGQDGAAAAVIPVSAARAERDAVVEAATADAARRQGPDPLQLARRIAAALNAPGSSRPPGLGFFWITGVTTDGAIVAANSYGLAYLPEGMQLPVEVHMASADPAIPAVERARWATYPVLAVQGWASHHDRKLRAVIGTGKHLANSDSGATKVVLKPDDIPDNGDMPGRSRLEVVNPVAAERLAATVDSRLISRLPPAPVVAEPPAEQSPPPANHGESEKDAPALPARLARRVNIVEMPPESASAGRPADQRTLLWMDVSKPLASSHPGRQAVHLSAFRNYAASSRDALLCEAHTVEDPIARRAAVADWLYWKHLAKLLDTALAGAADAS